MKILMLGSDKSVKGGITSVVQQLLSHNWGKKINIYYIPTFIESNKIKKTIFFIKSYFETLIYLLFKKTDIIYIHMSYKGSFWRKYLIHLLCKLFRKKTIIHLHGSEFEKFYNDSSNKVKNKIRKLLKDCDCIIVLGENWKKTILNIQPLANVEVLFNAVEIPNEISQRNEHFQILYLGMLIKRKGVDTLIDAMQLINKDNFLLKNHVELIITGIGPEENNLKKQVYKANLENYIKFSSWIDFEKKKEFLKNTQLLILPSYNEGLPVAILEALSYGIPVISTNVGSISEAVIHQENGFLFEPGNADELANFIIQIINSKELWLYLSQNAKNKAIDQFNDKEYFKKLSSIINKISEKY